MILKYRFAIYSLLFAGLIIIDQFFKYIIRTRGGFYICNQNIAFSLNVTPWLFWITWLVMIGLLAIFLYKNTAARYAFWLVIILAGSISNILDRIFLGCITDFIDLKFWPVFNLADIYITIGSMMILTKIFKIKSQSE